MKKLKEYLPLWDLIKKDKIKLLFASIIIFIAGLSSIFTGYLNGAAIEAVTNNSIKNAITYLGIYFFIELFVEGYLYLLGHKMLLKVESKLTRTISFEAYKKSLNLPAVA